MSLRSFIPAPAARLPSCGRHAQVVRASASQQRPNSNSLTAAFAAACLLMGSPAWAITEAPIAQSYEQELQGLIEKRTGKAALPELDEFPEEKAIQDNVERGFIEEAAAEQELEVAKSTEEPESIKAQAIRESETAQETVAAPATTVKPATGGAGPAGISQTSIILLGAVATVGIAGVALSSNGSSTSAPVASAPPASDLPPPPPPAADTTPPPS